MQRPASKAWWTHLILEGPNDAKGAIRVTDCVSQRDFRDSAYYSDLDGPFGIEGADGGPGRHSLPDRRANGESGKGFYRSGIHFPHTARAAPGMASGKLKRLETLQKSLDSIPFPTPDQLQKIGLTPRESEILFWVMQGKRDSEVVTILSDKASVSLRTINNHVRNILAKMNHETRTGACTEALDRLKRKLSGEH